MENKFVRVETEEQWTTVVQTFLNAGYEWLYSGKTINLKCFQADCEELSVGIEKGHICFSKLIDDITHTFDEFLTEEVQPKEKPNDFYDFTTPKINVQQWQMNWNLIKLFRKIPGIEMVGSHCRGEEYLVIRCDITNLQDFKKLLIYKALAWASIRMETGENTRGSPNVQILISVDNFEDCSNIVNRLADFVKESTNDQT